jgi:hypothetical protein
MAPVAGKFVAYWQTAKKAFQKSTKSPKPSDTFLWFRRGVGVEAALKKLDAAAPKAFTSEANHARYDRAWNEFDTAFQAYEAVLKQVRSDPTTDVKKLPKGVTTAAYKNALTQLIKELNALNVATLGWGANATMVVGLTGRLERALARADDFIADVKADPTPDTFNKVVEDRARDITTEIGNIAKMKAKGMDTGRTQPTALFNKLTGWADKGRRVDAESTRGEVLLELYEFEQAIQGVHAWAGL